MLWIDGGDSSTMPNSITNAVSQGDSIALQSMVIHWAVWRGVVLRNTIAKPPNTGVIQGR